MKPGMPGGDSKGHRREEDVLESLARSLGDLQSSSDLQWKDVRPKNNAYENLDIMVGTT